jgi:hypothetical protein
MPRALFLALFKPARTGCKLVIASVAKQAHPNGLAQQVRLLRRARKDNRIALISY